MIRSLLKLSIVLTLLLVLPIVAIHAQPYDFDSLRTSPGSPADCPMPCFMGIRPGLTTPEEAFAHLTHHTWVQVTSIVSTDEPVANADFTMLAPAELSWHWATATPKWVNEAANGLVSFWHGYVNMLTVTTRLKIGDAILIFGQPDRVETTIFDNAGERTIHYAGRYLDEGVVISAWGVCPVHIYNLRGVSLIYLSEFQIPDAPDTAPTSC